MSTPLSKPRDKYAGVRRFAEILKRCATAGGAVSRATSPTALRVAEANFRTILKEVIGHVKDLNALQKRLTRLWDQALPGLKVSLKGWPELVSRLHWIPHYLWYYLRLNVVPVVRPDLRLPVDQFWDPGQSYATVLRIHSEAASLADRLK